MQPGSGRNLAVFGITSHGTGDGQVWPEDLPTEVVQTFAERHARAVREDGTATPASSTPVRVRPALARIEGELKQEQQQEKAQDGAPKRHLRLVR